MPVLKSEYPVVRWVATISSDTTEIAVNESGFEIHLVPVIRLKVKEV